MSIPSFLRKSRGTRVQTLTWLLDSPEQSDLAHAKLAHDTVEAMASAVLEPFLPRVAQPAAIQLAWPHLDTDTQHLQNLLGHVLRQRQTNQPELGINIMLHGGPGTGKTEFARMLCQGLAASHGAAAYSVTAKDEDGDAADRQDRLASLRLSQKLAGNAPAILVLDEAEDIFQSDYNNPFAALFKGKSSEQENKAWTNNLLESNPHPVIWISNRISHLDPAYLRRFAYVLEFKNPPRSQRLSIAHQHLAPVGASADLLERLSHNNALTPAMLASSARFVSLVNTASLNKDAGDGLDSALAVDANIQHHIQLQLKALGKTATSKTPELVTRFDTRYLNASGRHSAQRIAEALARTRRGTVLLTGMPGTGKTQLAAHMAERCNMELIYRTAADINDMYYGQSERNVAQLFDNCDIHNQIIFLDEADTLLMSRREDSHRADRAVTSEFLRRLEAFQGIFMCATNHGDLLDPALMRRFVFRLDFAPLNQIQRTQLLQELLGGTKDIPILINDCIQQRLNRLDRLTPGDYANCKKRLSCLDEHPTVEEWLDELEQEHNVKPLVRGRVGFM